MKAAIVAAALLAGGCTTDLPARDRCRAEPAQRFVGRPVAEADQARRASGADSVRVIPPDAIVTLEYRYGRLTVEQDAAGLIREIRCG